MLTTMTMIMMAWYGIFIIHDDEDAYNDDDDADDDDDTSIIILCWIVPFNYICHHHGAAIVSSGCAMIHQYVELYHTVQLYYVIIMGQP